MALYGAAYNSATRSARQQMNNDFLARKRAGMTGSIKSRKPKFGIARSSSTVRSSSIRTPNAPIKRVATSSARRSVGPRSVTPQRIRAPRINASSAIRAGGKGATLLNRAGNFMKTKGGKAAVFGSAIAGGAAFAAYKSAQRTGRDINQSLGNPASQITSWTTYNRASRGY